MDNDEKLKRTVRSHLEAKFGASITPAQIEALIEEILALIAAFDPTTNTTS
jgi:hypothetical protein